MNIYASKMGGDIQLAVGLLILGLLLFVPFFILIQSGTLFIEEAQYFAEGLRPEGVFVSNAVSAYIAALFFWGATLLLVGAIWVYVGLRNMTLGQQFMCALAIGFLIMPLNVLLGSVASALGFITPEAFESHALRIVVENTETSYAILNILALFLAGIIFAITREVLRIISASNGGS